MAGPWEKYQQQDGPWTKYAPAAPDQPPVWQDMVASGAAGVARGAADLAGFPGTIGDYLRGGGQWALSKGYELATGDAPSQEGGAFERFFAGNPELEVQMVGGGSSPASGENLKRIMSALTDGATDYQPYTTAGEYARTAGEFLPGAAAFGGGSAANLIKAGLAPALSSEAAGQATEDTAFEPYARILAALGAGYGASKIGGSKAKLPSASEIKQSAGYDALKQPMKDARLSGNTYRRIVSDIWAEANDFGLTTQLKSQFGGTLRDHLKRAEGAGGASLHDLELLRRSLRNAAGDKLDDASQALSSRLIDKLDDAVSNLSEANIVNSGASGRPVIDALEEARGVYRTGMKAQMIENAMDDASRAASGFENGIRNEFRKLLKSKNARNFTQLEKQAIEDVVLGGFKANAARFLGTFGFPVDQARNWLGALGGGGVGSTVGGKLGGPMGAFVGGLTVPIVGTGFKEASKQITRNQASLAEALVKAGPEGAGTFATALAERGVAGREAIVRALLQSQSAAQVPSAKAGVR